jgi:8-oxo-dGTP pyrophosphatase MutT (NUDIX family)
MRNPWKTLTSREIYKNAWIRLREDQVITPTGTKGIYGVVEMSPAIGIVPVTEDLYTYLVGQYRYPLETYSWEIPEGGGHIGESFEESARRELREETGLSAAKWTPLGSMYTSNSVTNEVGHLFLAEQLTQHASSPDHTEELEIRKVPFLDAWQMVQEQEIKDALAVIGLLRAHEYLKNCGRI